jgi:hypothetical protein
MKRKDSGENYRSGWLVGHGDFLGALLPSRATKSFVRGYWDAVHFQNRKKQREAVERES